MFLPWAPKMLGTAVLCNEECLPVLQSNEAKIPVGWFCGAFFFFFLICICIRIVTLIFIYQFPLSFPFNLFIFLFLGVLGLRFCARALSSPSERGPLLIAVRGPLTVTASPVAEHGLQTRRPSSRGSRAQPLRGMWDPPRPGPEPVSPALAGRLSTTAPPGKPFCLFLLLTFSPLNQKKSLEQESGQSYEDLRLKAF